MSQNSTLHSSIQAFLSRFRNGVQVAVGGDLPDKLSGVHDGFVRYFRDGLAIVGGSSAVPISIHPQPQDEAATRLPLHDRAILDLARCRARDLQHLHKERFHFYVGSEAGLLTRDCDDEVHHFVRNWTVILGSGGEAWGSSGSMQLPKQLIEDLEDAQARVAIPGTRRGGGMVSSLTGGLENRRTTTALATLNALSSLLYSVLGQRPKIRH